MGEPIKIAGPIANSAPFSPALEPEIESTGAKTAIAITGLVAGAAASYFIKGNSLKDEIEKVCGKGIPPALMDEIISSARLLDGGFDKFSLREPSREEKLLYLCLMVRQSYRAPFRIVVREGVLVEDGISKMEIQWGVALKTLGYGLLTIGAGAATIAGGLATIVTIADPIPGDEVAVGSATAAMAGMTATAATTFYFSAREFLKSIFD